MMLSRSRLSPMLPVRSTRIIGICRPQRGKPCAADKGDNPIAGLVTTGKQLIDRASDLVPESVPRPVAKGGMALLGGLFIFGLIQKVLSGFITIFALAGLGYYFFTRSGGDDDDSDRPRKTEGDDLNDPLSDARRIMDKYK